MQDRAYPLVRGLGVPGLDGVAIPDLAAAAWADVVRRARRRSDEIVARRMNRGAEAWALRRWEYQHFYSGWVGMAFRLRACAGHNTDYTASFARGGGAPEQEELYAEDTALFGFFVAGVAALGCMGYALYALGALLRTSAADTPIPDLPTDAVTADVTFEAPILPPARGFPLLDPRSPRQLRRISLAAAAAALEQQFLDAPLVARLRALLADGEYRRWGEVRNVLAHRAASAGRTFDYSHLPLPLSGWPPPAGARPQTVEQWGGGGPLTAETTAARYRWLREALNACVADTAAFTAAQLAYEERELAQLLR